jgi:hypothetical protein
MELHGNKYYDGSSWLSVPDDSDTYFKAWGIIDSGIATHHLRYLLVEKIKIKARLFPSDDAQYTPLLYYVNLYHELYYDLEEDLVRSFKKYLEDNLSVRELYRVNVAAKNKVTMVSSLNEAEDSDYVTTYSDENMFAYNLTTDPGRTTNLATTLVGTQVNLSSSQSGTMEIQIDADLPIYISTADEKFYTSKSRALIFSTSSSDENEVLATLPVQGNSIEYEPVFSQFKIRKRKHPRSVEMFQILITVQAPSERQALSYSTAVRRLLDSNTRFISRATGKSYAITKSRLINGLIVDGLYSKAYDLCFVHRRYKGEYESIHDEGISIRYK